MSRPYLLSLLLLVAPPAFADREASQSERIYPLDYPTLIEMVTKVTARLTGNSCTKLKDRVAKAIYSQYVRVNHTGVAYFLDLNELPLSSITLTATQFCHLGTCQAGVGRLVNSYWKTGEFIYLSDECPETFAPRGKARSDHGSQRPGQ